MLPQALQLNGFLLEEDAKDLAPRWNQSLCGQGACVDVSDGLIADAAAAAPPPPASSFFARTAHGSATRL